jgi:uridine kinase
VRLVAVDGPGGAGKSTFARRLAVALGGATILETDDFASWDVPLGWWDRLERDALEPIAAGRPVRYRRHDWTTGGIGDWREHQIGDVVVLEGVSSSRRAATDRLSYAIWVEVPPAVRLARGIERDGEEWRPHWDRWMAEEDAFFAADRPWERVDLVVDASPTVAHDPEREFVEVSRRDASSDRR